MPVSEIKVDKRFVMNMLADDEDETIVQIIIRMAHELGLELTAEGVENQDIIDRLIELGCDTVQGYYLSRPLPLSEFNLWQNAYSSETFKSSTAHAEV